MSSVMPRIAQRPRFWGLVCAALVASTAPASAQIGYGGYGIGGGYGGYPIGGGYGGYGIGGGGGGYGGYGGGYGGIGYGGGGGVGYGGLGGAGGFAGIGVGGFSGGYGGTFGGYPLQSSINAYNLGYGNTLGIGLVPPAYVGTGTAGIGPIGIGGTNPLFGLGLSPLAIHNAVAEQSLRPYARNSGYYRGYNAYGFGANQVYGGGYGPGNQYGTVYRTPLYNNQTPTTLPNSYTNQTIPGAVSTVPR